MLRPRRAIPVLLAAAAFACGGTIVTTDGTSVTGTLKKTDDGWDVTQDDGQVRSVPTRKVKSIELGNDQAGRPGRDSAGLKSLRRSVEFSDDIPRILQRYKAFIAQTKDAATIAAANADVATWQDRLDRKLVKFGRTWGTAEDRDAAARRHRQQAEDARLFIKAARDKDAAGLVDAVLADDPQNVSALYLDGVLGERRKALNDAKKSYQALQQVLPNHPPTLVNLAVINFRQKQWAAASLAMDQALAYAPNTQVLLDTAAELINATPPDARRLRGAQQLAKTFLAQDAALQREMAARKMYRWGGTWVDAAAFEKIKKANDDIAKKLADLQKQFDETQTKITTAEKRMESNADSMRQMESNSLTRNSAGQLVRLPLPRLYYDLQAENAQLKQQADADRGSLQTMRDEAVRVRQSTPVPPYTGVINSIGEDGVPLAVLPNDAPPGTAPSAFDPPPATQPTTVPDVIRIGPPDAGIVP